MQTGIVRVRPMLVHATRGRCAPRSGVISAAGGRRWSLAQQEERKQIFEEHESLLQAQRDSLVTPAEDENRLIIDEADRAKMEASTWAVATFGMIVVTWVLIEAALVPELQNLHLVAR